MPPRAHNCSAADPVEELRSAPAEQDPDGEAVWEPVAVDRRRMVPPTYGTPLNGLLLALPFMLDAGEICAALAAAAAAAVGAPEERRRPRTVLPGS